MVDRMGKNNYIAQREANIQAFVQATCDVYSQYVHDCAIIALHEEFGFGPDRCKRFRERLKEVLNQFDDALSAPKDKDKMGDVDYLRGLMDESLKQITPENEKFYTFEERYPKVKRLKYGK
jgi:hypothetical protein